MVEVLIDGVLYRTCETAEEATQLRSGLRRWASTSTRIETRAVGPVAVDAGTPVPTVPPVCAACTGTGVAIRLRWIGARGGWCWVDGPCRACAEAEAA